MLAKPTLGLTPPRATSPCPAPPRSPPSSSGSHKVGSGGSEKEGNFRIGTLALGRKLRRCRATIVPRRRRGRMTLHEQPHHLHWSRVLRRQMQREIAVRPDRTNACRVGSKEESMDGSG